MKNSNENKENGSDNSRSLSKPPIQKQQIDKSSPTGKNNSSSGFSRYVLFRISSGIVIVSVLIAVCFPKSYQQAVKFSNFQNIFCFGNSSDKLLEARVDSEGSCDENVCSIEAEVDFMGFDVTPQFLQNDETVPQPSNQQEFEQTHKDDSPSKWWTEDIHLWKTCKTGEEFEDITNSNGIVVVDYFAVWCDGCKRIHSDLNTVAKELAEKCTFVKINVDAMRQIVHREGVKSLPYIQVYRDGNPLFGFQAVPWKVQNLKSNLLLALNNQDKGIELDANGVGSLVETEFQQQQQQNQKQVQSDVQKISSDEPLLQKMVKSSQLQHEPRLDISLDLVEDKSVPEKDAEFKLKKEHFLQEFGDDYGYGGRIEQLYASEVAPRMQPHEHYMDYTGASVYCNSQLKASLQELEANMFGNPHSANPSSKLTEEKVEEVRDMIVRFFGADPSEYQAVFTKSATGALQIVGETFPWAKGSIYRYLTENHNSVLGIREYALSAGANFQAVHEDWVEDWIGGKVASEHPLCGNISDPTYSLFAYPAEDNFAGVKYPLSWIRKVQNLSRPGHKWLTLLDAAAYVPTQPLNLTKTPADFVAISFYKMFGYPTGIGALILKTEHADILQKNFLGRGSSLPRNLPTKFSSTQMQTLRKT
eukprot:TRINITY_DN3793_c0_g1_i7.p1 TRINITY_DN3793_c0_g1~~TRINITY_DN3793_c0_g1_i7.p1  ORF type:complete len:652 (+),score=114.99 TRINITY_DN3793_c0_g1_i7:24-1958(+)